MQLNSLAKVSIPRPVQTRLQAKIDSKSLRLQLAGGMPGPGRVPAIGCPGTSPRTLIIRIRNDSILALRLSFSGCIIYH